MAAVAAVAACRFLRRALRPCGSWQALRGRCDNADAGLSRPLSSFCPLSFVDVLSYLKPISKWDYHLGRLSVDQRLEFHRVFSVPHLESLNSSMAQNNSEWQEMMDKVRLLQDRYAPSSPLFSGMQSVYVSRAGYAV